MTSSRDAVEAIVARWKAEWDGPDDPQAYEVVENTVRHMAEDDLACVMPDGRTIAQWLDSVEDDRG